jgi:hypothetical protein
MQLRPENLIDTLIDTRELAHARAARFEDLGDFQALAPAMMFQGTGDSGLHLDDNTQVSL